MRSPAAWRLSCVLILTSTLGVGAVVADDLARDAGLINSPTLGQTVTIKDSLKLGRAEITLKGASAHRLLAGDQPCGVIIDGAAGLIYRVDDVMSAPIAERNIDRATSLDSELDAKLGTLVLGVQLKGAVIWSWGLEAQVSSRASASEPEPSHDEPRGELVPTLPRWAARILERPFFSAPANELLNARGLGSKNAVYALLQARGEDLLLVVDPATEKLETLYRIDKVDNMKSDDYNRHYLEELAAQPIGRRWWDRFPAPLVAVKESISVDNYEGEQATVQTSSMLQATRGNVGLWRVSLVDRTVDSGIAYPNTVDSVRVNGEPASYIHQGSELLVEIDPPLASGSMTTVEVANSGHLARHPGGDTYFALGTWAWYPQPASNGEFASVELELRAPEEMTLFATGNQVSLETKDGYTTLRTRLDKPIQYPVMAAGRYKIFSEERDGVTCRVASYVFGKERACKRLINNFFAASDFYSSLFGIEFPFEQLDVIEINSWGFGQAPAGIIFITQEAYEPLTNWMNTYFSGGVNERYVHEVAHTWWGHIVKQDSPEEEWLAESFAEYSAALCLEAAKGGGRKGKKEFDALLKGWKARAKLVGDRGSIYLANHLANHDEKDQEDRIHLLYSKGPLVIHALRQELQRHYGSEKEGDRYFALLLGAMMKNFEFKWATTQHLIGILDQMTGKSWQPWFERYVYGVETPKIS